MTQNIQWAEPPERGGRCDHAEFAKALRDNPGAWAVMPGSYSRQQATAINRGRLKNYPIGEFDAVARSRGAGMYDIYVRYVGDGEATR